VAVLALALGGCAQNTADQVRAKVVELARAAAARNYGEICSDVLAPSLVAHLVSNGIPCSEGVQAALSSVHDPVINVGKVRVRGQRAWAVILASARGQRAQVSGVELVQTARGWRILSLDSSVAAAAGRSDGGGGATGTSTGP
jgi:xanthine dehydrogenase molybdopterin-binding subunit B